MELKTPVIVEERAFRTDSGGPGQYRGGLGLSVRVRNLVDGKWNMARPRRQICPPWGVEGGHSGGGAEYLLRLDGESDFHSADSVMRPVPANSQVIIRTGGGGGWGEPFTRAPLNVLEDVIQGLVTVEGAQRDYGVVINASTLVIDDVATEALRNTGREKLQQPHPELSRAVSMEEKP